MRLRRPLAAVLSLAVMIAAGCESAPTAPDPDPDPTPATTMAVAFPGGTLNAEIAATRSKRDTGLMNRASIAPDSGMIFVWPADQSNLAVAFFMRDTHFDLSIAFLDADRRVLNIEDMTRDTETLHFAVAPFRYAVEAPAGWFAAHGVTAGAIASFTLPAGVIVDP